MSNRSTKGKIAQEYCRANKKMADRTLARKMRDERPDIYQSIENARSHVRICRGKKGVKTREGMINRDCYGDGTPYHIKDGTGKFDPKILIFDIETSPNLAWVWGCWKQNIGSNQMEVYSNVLCYAAKWLGKKKVIFDSRENDKDDRRVCETLWHLFDEADMVIAHNARAFDNKTMNTRWLSLGMKPPSPYKTYDTLKGVKRMFRHPSNKLDSLARYHNIGQKVEHEGFGLWLKCMNMFGDYSEKEQADAWKRMKKYNIEDVRLLEEFYLLIRAWDTRHPNVSIMYDDTIERCPVCGCTELTEMAQASYTSISVFPTFECANCGKKMRSGKRDKVDKNVYRNVL